MRHHAFYYAGDIEEGVAAALSFGERELGLSGINSPDLITLRYGLFSVDDARLICELASRAPLKGDAKLLVIATGRIFHEAQNALLKTFEEPAPGTYLVLIVPSEGNIIPTLRSRLLPLPGTETESGVSSEAEAFVSGTEGAREKIVEGILDQAKSDDAEEKQAARLAALHLAEGILRVAYIRNQTKGSPELVALLKDLSRLIPVLHERSAPLKPILEHLCLTTPAKI
jgi:hypothetical protein